MINNLGEICGFTTDASTGVQQGFLLRKGKFFAFNVPKSSSTTINCITDNGKLSGWYLDTETTPMPHAFIATPKCGRKEGLSGLRSVPVLIRHTPLE
jgi:hypothetical protein